MIGHEPLLYNKTMTTNDTEYSQALPEGTVKVLVQCRSANDVLLSFSPSQSGTNFITLKSGSVYYDDMIDASRTLYFQCEESGKILEILVWVK